MMKIFLLLMIICFGSFAAIAEEVFPLENAEWIEEEYYSDHNARFYYGLYMNGDTILTI